MDFPNLCVDFLPVMPSGIHFRYRTNVDYFKANYLQKKIDAVSGKDKPLMTDKPTLYSLLAIFKLPSYRPILVHCGKKEPRLTIEFDSLS